MLLTTRDMAELLGVSRMTYYGWVSGKPMRKTNQLFVRSMLKRLLAVMTDHGWPMPEVIAADQKLRKEHLIELLNQS
jgi:hypothetical protein